MANPFFAPQVFSTAETSASSVTNPLDGSLGNLSYNSSTQQVFVWNGSAWVEIAQVFDFVGDGLIYGGAVWLSGLTFDVTGVKFIRQGQVYFAGPDQVTLAAADPTNPRIDVIVANTDGTISVVTGTPSPDPVKPEIDLDTQIEITFATVAALATTPTGVSATDIYMENAGSPGEWDGVATAPGGTWVFNANTNPYSGTIHQTATSVAVGDRIDLTTPTPVPVQAIGLLELHLLPSSAWGGQKRLRLAFYNGIHRVSSWIEIKDGFQGFNSSSAIYQTLSISATDLNFTDVQVDGLRIEVIGGGPDINFLIDQIRYQAGVVTTTPDLFTVSDGTNTFDVDKGDQIEFSSSDASVSIDASVPGIIDFTANVDNIYTADGTIGSALRTVTIGGNRLLFTQTGSSVFGIEVQFTDSSIGTPGAGILINSTNRGNAIRATASAGSAVVDATNSSSGWAGRFENTNGSVALEGHTGNATTNTILDTLRVRRTSTGTAAVGIGAAIAYWLPNNSGGAGALKIGDTAMSLTNVGVGTETARYKISLANSGTLTERLSLDGSTGQLTLGGYGSGQTGTPTAVTAFTSTGQVIREPLTAAADDTAASGAGVALGSLYWNTTNSRIQARLS